MKKVLVILPNGNGGAERQSVRIASYLPSERFQVEYVVVGSSADKVGELIPDGAKLHLIRLSHIWQGGIFRIWRLFRREKPDVVFSSFHYLNGRCVLASRLAGIPRCVIRGNMSAIGDGDPLGRLLNFLYSRKASVVICQTDELREEAISLYRVSPETAIALYNAPDTRALDLAARDAVNPYCGQGPHFVNVARITKQKGQDVLLLAFLKVLEHIPDAKLYFVGGEDASEQAYVRSLKEFVKEHSLEQCVFFAGYQGNPVPWIKYADCFVLASRWEGLPNALIEAQYLGVPGVATDCVASMSRIIKEGANGYVVPTGDASALCAAMEKAVQMSDITFTYKPSSPEDFIRVFEEVMKESYEHTL